MHITLDNERIELDKAFWIRVAAMLAATLITLFIFWHNPTAVPTDPHEAPLPLGLAVTMLLTGWGMAIAKRDVKVFISGLAGAYFLYYEPLLVARCLHISL